MGNSVLGTTAFGQSHYFGLNLSLWFQSEFILFALKLLCAAADVHSAEQLLPLKTKEAALQDMLK